MRAWQPYAVENAKSEYLRSFEGLKDDRLHANRHRSDPDSDKIHHKDMLLAIRLSIRELGGICRKSTLLTTIGMAEDVEMLELDEYDIMTLRMMRRWALLLCRGQG